MNGWVHAAQGDQGMQGKLMCKTIPQQPENQWPPAQTVRASQYAVGQAPDVRPVCLLPDLPVESTAAVACVLLEQSHSRSTICVAQQVGDADIETMQSPGRLWSKALLTVH